MSAGAVPGPSVTCCALLQVGDLQPVPPGAAAAVQEDLLQPGDSLTDTDYKNTLLQIILVIY